MAREGLGIDSSVRKLAKNHKSSGFFAKKIAPADFCFTYFCRLELSG
jgi:hypothetical protein